MTAIPPCRLASFPAESPPIKTLPHRTVVIVGGGVAAGLTARQLTAQGIEVVVLERGGDHLDSAAAKLPTQRDELRWDVRAGLIQDPAVETYAWRHHRNEESVPLRRLTTFLPGTGVGGAGNHWGGQSWRWAEYDTQLRTRLESRYGKSAIPADMSVQDWGVSYAELEPHYDLFERLFGVGGQAGNLRGRILPGGNPFEAPRQNDFPQPAVETTEAGVLFTAGAARFGYKAFRSPAAISAGSYTNPDGMRMGACQYCGHCDRFICEASAKATPELLLYPLLEKRPHFELRRFCQVLKVDFDPAAGRVRAVEYLDVQTGEAYRQPADIVVLAAFVMSNAKLLLTSGIGRPYRPEDGTGVVGRNFCYQVTTGVSLFVKDRWLNPFLSGGGTASVVEEFNDDNFDHTGLGFMGGAFLASAISGRPIGSRRLPPGTPRWGSAWKQANADWYAHAFTIGVQGSCYPHRENFLDLDPDYTDPYGQPLVRITFDLQENERRMSAYVTAKAAEIARSMGADHLGPADPASRPYDTRPYQSTHIVGGTVMGADPATSVVSPHLQHWDAENLFVAGASVFPHNSGHNPTELVGALALRLGDDLVEYVKRPRRLG